MSGKKSLFVRIMAWVLAIIMAGSVATLAVSMILYAIGVQ